MTELLFASTNSHKTREMTDLLAPSGFTIVGLSSEISLLSPPAEDGVTFAENARIKARHYALLARRPCLADDSGLVVDVLGGAPGVYSARFAGASGSREERDRANRHRLLAELSKLGEVDRTARLVCTLCLADAEGNVLFETSGACVGQIIDTPRGGNGFGYDTLLYLPDRESTAAELAPDEWNAMSHRGAAARSLLNFLASYRHAPRARGETPG